MILLAMSVMTIVTYVVLALVCVLLVMFVLLQDSKAGGLSGFGAVGGDALLGARGQKDLARITVYLAVAFFVLCMFGSWSEQGMLVGSGVGGDDPLPVESPTVAPTSGNAQGSTGGESAPGPAGSTPAPSPPAGAEPVAPAPRDGEPSKAPEGGGG